MENPISGMAIIRKVPNQFMVGFNANLEARKWDESERAAIDYKVVERLAGGSHED